MAKLFAPDELRKGLPNLRQGADAGWPSLGDLAGRFALCLSGRKTAKRRYALAPGSRACFADLDVGPDRAPDPTELDHRVFLNANFLRWTPRLDQLDQLIRSGPWVLRAYYVNGDILWNAARSRQVALVATDNITHRWARIDLATARPFRALPPRGLV